tara:strand:+ start:408 stop:863 length:456 start_codon:yes stop_codon:yes gene_type:complete
MSKKLTDKQERFSQLVVKYGNQSKAYREAYDVKESTKDTTVTVKASELMTDGNVSVRVEQLRNESKQEHKIDRDSIALGLLKIINDVDYTVDLAKLKSGEATEVKKFYMMKEVNTVTDKLRAYDMLMKMYGLNAPKKIDVNITSFKTNWGE